jgi:hypothetical protein
MLMGRRCLVWILCGLLLMTAVAGLLGCKEEEEALQEKETAAQEEQVASGTAMSDTSGMEDQTGEFEEEEGVQQESPPQYDY